MLANFLAHRRDRGAFVDYVHALAAEAGSSGMTANVVVPGLVDNRHHLALARREAHLHSTKPWSMPSVHVALMAISSQEFGYRLIASGSALSLHVGI